MHFITGGITKFTIYLTGLHYKYVKANVGYIYEIQVSADLRAGLRGDTYPMLEIYIPGLNLTLNSDHILLTDTDERYKEGKFLRMWKFSNDDWEYYKECSEVLQMAEDYKRDNKEKFRALMKL